MRLMEMKIVVAATILLLLASASASASAVTETANYESQSEALANPSCKADEWCGDIRIPYPFGTKPECYLNKNFSIYCDKTKDPPQAFVQRRKSNINVTNISTSLGELHILASTARDCYTKDGIAVSSKSTRFLNVPMFTISHTKNELTVIGCDTFAYIYGVLDIGKYKSACVALCEDIRNVREGSCSGSGCCQLAIPQGLRKMKLRVRSFENHTKVVNFNPCGYAFVTEKNNFIFKSKYIQSFPQEKVPMVLDWAISNETCSKAKNKTNCLCGPNSRKISFLAKGSDYRCQCLEGYQGNPYLPQGCQDINECKDDSLNDCEHKWRCVNTVGNYTCVCPHDYKGDGRIQGQGCTRNPVTYIPFIIGISVGIPALLICMTWLYLIYKKWSFIKLKEKFFEKNGGLILQQHLFTRQGPTDFVRIFTQQELNKATKNYDESSIVGRGGYGTVYKGVLEDGLIVAIKKSKLIDQSQTDQFINEVIVLSQINHRNVVRLIGCCLETEVPLLVYEFIPNGTLFDHIHNKTQAVSLSWEVRLRIASETAGVLSYLHSSASTPIIHRDIKPTNILLDHTCTAKVSDFGASKLVPMDQTQLSTMVQGTLGYLDPEYLLTSELTEKSDVYSFGIVLLELLTGKKAVSFEGPEDERNLAMYVLCAMKEDRLKEVVEKRIVTEANFEQMKETAKLAKKCLRIKGEERPTMKEVAMELEGLKLMVEHPWVVNDVLNMEEMTYLLDGTSNSTSFVVSDTLTLTANQITSQVGR